MRMTERNAKVTHRVSHGQLRVLCDVHVFSDFAWAPTAQKMHQLYAREHAYTVQEHHV